MIQVDQVVGANWPACYADWHGHPKGRGRWMTEVFTEQLIGMRDAMRKIEPDAVVCIEEPNEWFNHLMGVQDYRNCETAREWASVFNYIYHEHSPPFQSNLRRGNRVDAHLPGRRPDAPHGAVQPRLQRGDARQRWIRSPDGRRQVLPQLGEAPERIPRRGMERRGLCRHRREAQRHPPACGWRTTPATRCRSRRTYAEAGSSVTGAPTV